MGENLKIFEFTIKNGEHYNVDDAIFIAAKFGKANILELTLNKVEDKEARCLMREKNNKSLLHHAARSGNVEAINIILSCITDKSSICQEGAEIFRNNKLGFPETVDSTVLGCAWQSGNAKAVIAILAFFADKHSVYERLSRWHLGESNRIDRKDIINYLDG